MKRRRQVSRMKIGIFGVIVSMLLVYGVFTKRIPFLHGYRVTATFKSSNQLVPGFSPVRIAGVTVGKVTKVENGPGDTAKVTMELEDTALPLHKDTTARIRPRLFLEGGFAVELKPGSPSAPVLEDGDAIPQNQTANPVQFDQILSTFDHPTRDELKSLLLETDKGFDNEGAKSFGDAMEPLAPLLRDVALITEASRGVKPHDASETISSGAKVTRALASRDEDLRGLLTSLNITMTALASRDTQLAATVRETDELVIIAPPNLDRIDAVMPTVRQFVSDVRPTLRELAPVLEHTVPVLKQLKGAVGPDELPETVELLEPTVNRLPQISGRLQQMFPLVTDVMDCLRTRVAPVLLSEVPDGPLSSGQPAFKDLTSALVGLASSNQSFDGNGYAIRYTAGVGEQVVGTGTLPGGGSLTGVAAQEIVGSRPTWLGPGVVPPLRPDEPCMEQDVADLTQRTSGTPIAGTQARIKRERSEPTRRQLREAVRAAEREAAE